MNAGGPIPPPASLPLRHFATVPVAIIIAGLVLFVRGGDLTDLDFDARLALGLTHCLTLGAVVQAIFGVWSQMIPVHGGTELASVRVAKASWWLLTLGAIIFIGSIWLGSTPYWPGAMLVAAGIGGELTVFALTQRRVVKRDWTGLHFSTAMCWLGVLAVLGAMMAWDRQRGILFRDPEGALIAHVHAALIGFAGITTYGAGYRLLPWVGVRRLNSPWEGRICFVLTMVGLTGLVLDALFFGRRLMPWWAGMLAMGFFSYTFALRSAPIALGVIDASTATALLSFAGGAAWCAIGLGLSLDYFLEVTAARAAFVFTALVGTLIPLILSQLRRVGPVIAWSGASRITGLAGLPTLAEMASPRSARIEFAGCALAAVAGAAGFLREDPTLIRLAGAGLVAAGGASGYHLAKALRLLYSVQRKRR